MARDAIKFVRAFGGAIMESTPHLYISALPCSPVKSIIYTEFSPKYSNLAQIVDGGELHWPNLQLTIRGHFFTSVTFSADGKTIASGSYDRTICLWDAETGLQLGSPLPGHTDWVSSVAFSPDGRRIASGSHDNTICLWDAETQLQLGSPLTGYTKEVSLVVFSPDGKRIASGSHDNTICLWDAKTGLQLGSPLTGHTEAVTSVAFSPDGKRIASGSWDNTICLWDAETGLQLGSPLLQPCPTPDPIWSLRSHRSSTAQLQLLITYSGHGCTVILPLSTTLGLIPIQSLLHLAVYPALT